MNNIRFAGVKTDTPYYTMYDSSRVKTAADEAYEMRGDHDKLNAFNGAVDMAVISEKERIMMLKEEILLEQKAATKIATEKYREMFPSSNIDLVRALLLNEPTVMEKLGVDENNLSNDNIMQMNQNSLDKQYQNSQKNFVAEVVNKGIYKPVTAYNK